jgi:hypothetical protein
MNAPGLRPVEAPAPQPSTLEALPGGAEIKRADRELRSFVAERPVLAVLMALTAGYVVGRIISRAT